MNRRYQGLTLIELMVTLAVAIVVLAIGIPAFNSLTARDVSAATVNAIVTALQVARVEALSRQLPVVVQPASVALACPTAGGTNWAGGWTVFVCEDTDDDGEPDDPVTMRQYPALRKEVAFATGTPAYVEFGSNGERQFPGGGGEALFRIRAYADQAKTKCVRETDIGINAAGRIRTEVKSQCT
jgi:type IV fimbrial biogenesis protein FimT